MDREAGLPAYSRPKHLAPARWAARRAAADDLDVLWDAAAAVAATALRRAASVKDTDAGRRCKNRDSARVEAGREWGSGMKTFCRRISRRAERPQDRLPVEARLLMLSMSLVSLAGLAAFELHVF